MYSDIRLGLAVSAHLEASASMIAEGDPTKN